MGYILSGASLAHTYGNVTAFYTNFIKGLFPDDFFKTVHISSKIAFREFNILQNKNKEYFKKSKPMLIIRPRMDINNSDEFLKGSYLTTRIANQLDASDMGNLQDILIDNDNGKYLKYLMNRMTMLFDVSIIVETQLQQLNTVTFLKNALMCERPFMIPTCLENNIPRELMEKIAKDVGHNIDNEESSQKFVEYLNTHSLFPITYKMKNSTGNNEFFRYYPVNIDTTVSQYDIDDGSKKGFVADTYTINFTVNAEFWIAGLFYYFSKTVNKIAGIESSIIADGKIIPIFTVSNIYDTQLPEGWKLYKSPMYKVDYTNRVDEMDISSLLNSSLTACLKYHKDHNINNNIFIHISVMKDNVALERGKDFEIDFDKMILYTYKTNNTSTYRLFIYVNPSYINNLISSIYEFDKEK